MEFGERFWWAVLRPVLIILGVVLVLAVLVVWVACNP